MNQIQETLSGRERCAKVRGMNPWHDLVAGDTVLRGRIPILDWLYLNLLGKKP
jgi:hypothetical protein